MTTFPIDLTKYQRISLDVSNPTLTNEQKTSLKDNIQLCRDAIVFSRRLVRRAALATHRRAI